MAPAPAHAERALISSGGFSASLADGTGCADAMAVRVTTEESGMFVEARGELQKLLGGLRAVLGFDCEGVERIDLEGVAAGAVAYRGHASADGGWRLVDAVSRTRDLTGVPASLAGLEELGQRYAALEEELAPVPGIARERLVARAREVLPEAIQELQGALGVGVRSPAELVSRRTMAEEVVQALAGLSPELAGRLEVARQDWIEAELDRRVERDIEARIAGFGSGHGDISALFERADALARELDAAGLTRRGGRVVAAALDRAEALAEAGLPAFEGELEALAPTRNALATLEGMRRDLEPKAEVVPALQAYVEALNRRARALEGAICTRVAEAAGLSAEDAARPVRVAEGSLPLGVLACRLDANGHVVEGAEKPWFSRAIRLTLTPASERTVEVELRRDEGSEGLLVGQTLVRDGEEEALSAEAWLAYVGALLQPPVTGVPDADGVTDCDRLAADPVDPQRVAEGVALDALDLPLAREACALAVARDPESPRLLYQLGRVQYAAGEQLSALELFELAHAGGSGPAAHFIGEALFLNAGGEASEAAQLEAALAYYRAAAGRGYEPAGGMVPELEEMVALLPEAYGTAEEEREFPTDGFKVPGIMHAVYFTHWDRIPDSKDARAVVAGVARGVNEFCPGSFEGGGVNLVEYAAGRRIVSDADQAMQFWGDALQGLLGGLRGGGAGGLADFFQQNALYAYEGIDDGHMLAVMHECESETLQRFRQNLGDLVAARVREQPAPGGHEELIPLMSDSYLEEAGWQPPQGKRGRRD